MSGRETQAAIKATVQPGTEWEITNHYITRPDHPCYGTTRRTIERTSRQNVTVLRHDPDGYTYDESIPWGKGLERDDDGTIRLYHARLEAAGLVTGPFLTLRPVTS